MPITVPEQWPVLELGKCLMWLPVWQTVLALCWLRWRRLSRKSMHLIFIPYSLTFNINNILNFRTVTSTLTVTTTTTLVGMKRHVAALEHRQVTVMPSSVPIYASACSGTARYSSACSCWGITAMTTTAPTPLTTTTVTVTATASVCPTGDTMCGTSCFNLQTDSNNCGTCNNVVGYRAR